MFLFIYKIALFYMQILNIASNSLFKYPLLPFIWHQLIAWTELMELEKLKQKSEIVCWWVREIQSSLAGKTDKFSYQINTKRAVGSYKSMRKIIFCSKISNLSILLRKVKYHFFPCRTRAELTNAKISQIILSYISSFFFLDSILIYHLYNYNILWWFDIYNQFSVMRSEIL